MREPIYLDYHATTPCDPRVVEEMLPYFTSQFGNASSGMHSYGRRAADAVDEAREQVAELIGATSAEIVFTSGATESNNIVISGLANEQSNFRSRIVTTPIEHKAVLEPFHHLEGLGYEVIQLPVDQYGTVDLDAAYELINDSTLLVSVHAANNEIGTIQPLQAIADIARSNGALIHTDAAQLVGKAAIDVETIGVDFLSISGHKMYGPKGIGALYTRRGVRRKLSPLLRGGGQEAGIRPGTLNVPGIVGIGAACRIALHDFAPEAVRLSYLRDRLEALLLEGVPGLKINGNLSNRLPGNSSLTFPEVEADTLIYGLPSLALSTGSACTTGAVEPSHVLTSIGLSRDSADRTIRVGLGRFSTATEIETAASLLTTVWQELNTDLRTA